MQQQQQQQQTPIHAISRIPPPSYDEATGPPGAPKDYTQPAQVGQHVYGQYPQAVPYPLPSQGYQDQNVFYPGGVPPGATRIYVTTLPEQVVAQEQERGSCIGGCIWIMMLTIFVIMFIKIFLYMSYNT